MWININNNQDDIKKSKHVTTYGTDVTNVNATISLITVLCVHMTSSTGTPKQATIPLITLGYFVQNTEQPSRMLMMMDKGLVNLLLSHERLGRDTRRAGNPVITPFVVKIKVCTGYLVCYPPMV